MTPSPAAYSSDETNSTGRPPWRSMVWPTLGEINPATRRPIEVPLTTADGHQAIRVSLQGYNTYEDGQKLLAALRELIT